MSTGRASSRPAAPAAALAVAVALALVAGGCPERPRASSQRDAAPADRAAGAVIEVRGAEGALRLTVTPAGDGWDVHAAGSTVQVRRDGDDLVARDRAGDEVARLTPGPAGRRLVDGTGAPVARVVTEGGAFDVITPEGIGILRVAPDGDGAIGRDAAGVPVRLVRRDGPRLAVTDREGVRLGTVHQVDDPVAALLLAFEGLPAEHRAVLWAHRRAGATP